MPLTSLELPIDQNHPGWGVIAVREGVALLRQAGRPAMAAALEAQGEAGAVLETLSTYLRLVVTAGTAPARILATMAFGGPRRCGCFAAEIPDAVTELWSMRATPNSLEHGFSGPLVHNNLVFAGLGADLVAVHLEDGRELRRFDGPHHMRASAAIGGDWLVHTDVSGTLHGRSLSNEWGAWSVTGSGGRLRAPLVDGSDVLSVGPDGALRCFALESGEMRWSAAETLGNSNSAPALAGNLAGNLVVVGAESGALHAYDRRDGRDLWRSKDLGKLSATPALFGRTAVIGSNPENGDWLYGIDLYTGAVRWQVAPGQPFFASAAVSEDGLAVVGSRKGALLGVDVASGEVRWSHNSEGRDGARAWGTAAVAGTRAVLGCQDRKFRCIDLKDGSEIWSHELGSAVVRSAPAITHNGRILVSTADGRLVCLGAPK